MRDRHFLSWAARLRSYLVDQELFVRAIYSRIRRLVATVDGKAGATHEHAAADLTSGTLADARVAQSNVTQHRAAIGRFIDSPPAEVILDAADAVVFGNEVTDGSWRFIRSGSDLLVQRLETAVWTTKQTFIP